MKIWVDADACPRVIKDLLFRAAERTGVEVVLVANQPIRTPKLSQIRTVTVGRGFDVADDYIAEQVAPGELVITADIPLAAAVVERGALVLDPRGNIIDENNAKSRLAMRDMLEEMRQSGEMTGGPKAWSTRDTHRFAGELDRWLQRRRASDP